MSDEELDTIRFIKDSAYEFDDEYDLQFIQWMTKRGKSYTTVADYLFRLEEFVKTQKLAEEFNSESQTSTIVVNDFADQDKDELDLLLSTGLLASQELESAPANVNFNVANLPTNVDWRTKGVVNPVR